MRETYIAATEFCARHNIEISFITSLEETGLIKITTFEEISYIHESHLQELERIVRFYYDLGINLEGIESITHLLQRINQLQDENRVLRNRLRFYESLENTDNYFNLLRDSLQ